MADVATSLPMEISSLQTEVPGTSIPSIENRPPEQIVVAATSIDVSTTKTSRIRRRSTSSRSRSAKSPCRSSSRSSSDYRHRRRYRRSRSRSHSRSGRIQRRRSSRTPSYRPPRRRQIGRPQRYSPYRSYRGGGGGGRGTRPYSSFPRRDSHTPTKVPLRSSPTRLLPSTRPPPVKFFSAAARGRTNDGAQVLSLTERFDRLVEITMKHNRREYGVLGGLSHLILTNRLKLPLPTLMREAKELSVVIERNLPPETSDPGAEISFDIEPGTNFVFIHPSNAGCKPVFERNDIPLFNKPGDEERIVKQLAATLSENSGDPTRHQYTDLYAQTGVQGGADNQNFKQRRINALNRLGVSNPLEVPKGASYFMHDTRDERPPYRGRNWRGGVGYSRDEWRQRWSGYDNQNADDQRTEHRRTSRYSGGGTEGKPDRQYRRPEPSEERWGHDKFLELEKKGDNNQLLPSSTSSPEVGSLNNKRGTN